MTSRHLSRRLSVFFLTAPPFQSSGWRSSLVEWAGYLPIALDSSGTGFAPPHYRWLHDAGHARSMVQILPVIARRQHGRAAVGVQSRACAA